MNVLDLFSGIGGFSLGLERAGMKTVAFCEIEKFPQAVLRKHWPDVPIYDDIRTLTAERLKQDGIGTIDVICGGFPCQPFSIAGRKQGTADHRDLWPEMFRLIKECQPTWVIGENVAGFVDMAFERTAIDLESEGYEVQPIIIPACAVGAPHKRDRIWIMAHSISTRRGKRVLCHKGNYGCGISEGASTFPSKSNKTPSPVADRNITDSSSERLQGLCSTIGRQAILSVDSFPSWRQIEPTIHRKDDGISIRLDKNRALRLKALGNSIVPQIPEIIGRAIMEVAA